jgi:outer membrane protein
MALLLGVMSGVPLAAQSATSAAPKITLTLEQAIARAASNQPLIDQARAAVAAARDRVGQAQSAYYPNVNGSASYNRIEPDQSYNFNLAADLAPLITALHLSPSAFPSIALSLLPIDNWDFHVSLTEVVTQFGRRGIQVGLAKSGVASAEIGLDQIKTSLGFQAAQGFLGVLFLRENVKALDSQLDNLTQHLDAIQVREQAGMATQFEVLSTRVRLSSLQSQHTDVQNQLQKQEIALKLLADLDPEADVEFSGSLAAGDPPSDPQAAVAQAMQKRADVRQAHESENAAELARQLALSSLFPTLAVRGAIGYKNGLLPDITTLSFDWMAGVSLNVPIFQGFLVARQTDEASDRLRAAKEGTASVTRNVTQQVLQAWQDLQSARRQVQTSADGLKIAEQMVDTAKVEYDTGVITNLEYLDAQTALEAATFGNLGALYKEVVCEYALRQVTGETLGAAAPESAAP